LALLREESPALKEFSKVPHVVKAWGERSLGELRVIEDFQAMVTDLQMAECLVLGMGWALKWLLVFEGRQWS
jgi:hypothetical protein